MNIDVLILKKNNEKGNEETIIEEVTKDQTNL